MIAELRKYLWNEGPQEKQWSCHVMSKFLCCQLHPHFLGHSQSVCFWCISEDRAIRGKGEFDWCSGSEQAWWTLFTPFNTIGFAQQKQSHFQVEDVWSWHAESEMFWFCQRRAIEISRAISDIPFRARHLQAIKSCLRTAAQKMFSLLNFKI